MPQKSPAATPPCLSPSSPTPSRSHHQRRDRHFGGDEGSADVASRRPCDRGPPLRPSVRPFVRPLVFSAGGIKSEHPRTQRTLDHDKTNHRAPPLLRCAAAMTLAASSSVKEVWCRCVDCGWTEEGRRKEGRGWFLPSIHPPWRFSFSD